MNTENINRDGNRRLFPFINISSSSLILLFHVVLFISVNNCSHRQDYPKKEKLLLISIDGFKPAYLDWYDTKNLDYLIKEGSTAEYMIPVFPTKTFPNHYSIATGLFTENSGIIANNIYDPATDEYFSLANRNAVQDAGWYGGEPIWVTAEKNGILTAPMFWPGSEAPISGKHPSRWSPYIDDLPYKARVDSVITWLTMEDESAPGFMTLYFSKVDTYGHRYGPKSDSTAIAVKEVDEYIGYLINELKRTGEWENLNIIVVSDHGMAEVSSDRVIKLDEIINLDNVKIIDWAPLTTLYPKEGYRDEIYHKLKAAEQNYRVYRKEDIPEHYNYKNHIRVPDIVVIAESGYTITSAERLESRPVSGGDHGYDYGSPEMRSLFIARGPSIKKGIKIRPFQNIHLYELMAELLNIEPAPNDGSADTLVHILVQ